MIQEFISQCLCDRETYELVKPKGKQTQIIFVYLYISSFPYTRNNQKHLKKQIDLTFKQFNSFSIRFI